MNISNKYTCKHTYIFPVNIHVNLTLSLRFGNFAVSLRLLLIKFYNWYRRYIIISAIICILDTLPHTKVRANFIQYPSLLVGLDWKNSTDLSYSCTRDYTQRNIFEILLNQPEIRLYLPCSNWFVTKRTSVWFQINQKIVNIIWFQFDLTRFKRRLSVHMSTNSFSIMISSVQKKIGWVLVT